VNGVDGYLAQDPQHDMISRLEQMLRNEDLFKSLSEGARRTYEDEASI